MIHVIRAELYKFRTTPGPWVMSGVVMALTALIVALAAFTAAGYPGHTFAAPHTVPQYRLLLGSGYLAALYVAPVLGVLCITTEYRHKVLTTSLLISPRREQVLGAKAVATVLWGFLLCVGSLVIVGAMGLTWLWADGGSVSGALGQAGAVIPGLFGAFALLSLYGLGIGVLLRNQIAGVLITLGFTVIIEQIIVALFEHVLNVTINWLPAEATRAFVGGIILGNGGGGGGGGAGGVTLLTWWQGGLVLLGWGLIPLTIGYFTTFRRDVT